MRPYIDEEGAWGTEMGDSGLGLIWYSYDNNLIDLEGYTWDDSKVKNFPSMLMSVPTSEFLYRYIFVAHGDLETGYGLYFTEPENPPFKPANIFDVTSEDDNPCGEESNCQKCTNSSRTINEQKYEYGLC